jgi:hypothetical protein
MFLLANDLPDLEGCRADHMEIKKKLKTVLISWAR